MKCGQHKQQICSGLNPEVCRGIDIHTCNHLKEWVCVYWMSNFYLLKWFVHSGRLWKHPCLILRLSCFSTSSPSSCLLTNHFFLRPAYFYLFTFLISVPLSNLLRFHSSPLFRLWLLTATVHECWRLKACTSYWCMIVSQIFSISNICVPLRLHLQYIICQWSPPLKSMIMKLFYVVNSLKEK